MIIKQNKIKTLIKESIKKYLIESSVDVWKSFVRELKRLALLSDTSLDQKFKNDPSRKERMKIVREKRLKKYMKDHPISDMISLSEINKIIKKSKLTSDLNPNVDFLQEVIKNTSEIWQKKK